MTREEAIGRVGRLLWGLAFVERHRDEIETDQRQDIGATCTLADLVLGTDWRPLTDPDEEGGHLTLTKRLLALDGRTAENFVAVVNAAVRNGFASLRQYTDTILADARTDLAYWESLYDFFSVPRSAIKAVGAALGTGIGAMVQAVLSNPLIAVALAVLIWKIMKGRK